MEIRQKQELKKLLAPELRHSLKVLTLPLAALKNIVAEELEDNPFLEEIQAQEEPGKAPVAPKKHHAKGFRGLPPAQTEPKGYTLLQQPDFDYRLSLVTKKESLQDALLRQLGMFASSEEEYKIGQEIIGNIDENGFLKATLAEIAASLKVGLEDVERILRVIHEFEPAGVGARTIQECLLIQLELAGEDNPLLRKIVEHHLEDMAKKNFNRIAKSLKVPLEKVGPLIKKILKLNPKPGRNYSLDEPQQIIPDIIIDEKDNALEIRINDEDVPHLTVNKAYWDTLKKEGIDPKSEEFLTGKLRNAKELLRAILKRQETLRKVIETVSKIQQEAICQDLSHLKPLTFKEVAQRINVHESTVCRVVMNKYVKTPHSVVALKDFFPSHVYNQNGETVSSSRVKKLISELIGQEDKRHPLSDRQIYQSLTKKHQLKVSRRTVAKYREELKLLSSVYRRIR